MKTTTLLIIGLLLTLFVGPIVAAWSLYETQFFRGQTINYGRIIDPPIALQRLIPWSFSPSARFYQGKWLLLYLAPPGCDSTCLNRAARMQQVQVALGKDRDRLVVGIVSLENLRNAPPFANPMVLRLQTTSQALAQFTKALAKNRPIVAVGRWYIVDPLENVMMVFRPDQAPTEILKDLKRLLRVSQIG